MGTDILINFSDYKKENTENLKNKSFEFSDKNLDKEYEVHKKKIRYEIERMLTHLDNMEDSYARVVPVRSLSRQLQEINDLAVILN